MSGASSESSSCISLKLTVVVLQANRHDSRKDYLNAKEKVVEERGLQDAGFSPLVVEPELVRQSREVGRHSFHIRMQSPCPSPAAILKHGRPLAALSPSPMHSSTRLGM